MLDPARVGFLPRFPGDGWSASGIGFAPMAGCGPAGDSGEGGFRLTSTWTRLETGSLVQLTQASAPEPTPNIFYEPWWVSFWSEGYTWEASLGWWAGAGGEVPGAGLADTGPADDTLAVLVSRLAPNLSLDCFYRQRSGSWEELASLGIGDVRPVVPAGFSESGFSLNYLSTPTPDCGVPTPMPGGVGFSAGFWRESDMGWISVSASSVDAGFPGGGRDGYIDSSGAWWSNDRYSYSVLAMSGPEGGAFGVELVEALARALDPTVDFDCFFATSELTSAEVVALGFHLPIAPENYHLAGSWLVRQGAPAGCPGAAPPVYSFYWSFSNEAALAMIDAGLWRDESTGPMPPSGWLGEGFVFWNDAAGTAFSVSGFSLLPGSAPSQEMLLGVARSLDPTLDPTILVGGVTGRPVAAAH